MYCSCGCSTLLKNPRSSTFIAYLTILYSKRSEFLDLNFPMQFSQKISGICIIVALHMLMISFLNMLVYAMVLSHCIFYINVLRFHLLNTSQVMTILR